MIIILYLTFISMIIFGVCSLKRLANPITIFNIVWFAAIAFYNLQLSKLQSALLPKTITVFIIMSISFSISCWFFSKIKLREQKEKNIKIPNSKIRLMLMIWIAIEMVEIAYSGGVPMLWKILGIHKTYKEFGISSVHGFMNAFSLVVALLGFYNYKIEENKIEKKKMLKYILIIIGFNLLVIVRQVIITLVLELGIISLFFRKKIPWKKYFIIMIIGIICFGVIGNFRTGYDGFYRVALIKKPVSKYLVGFHWVYMYLTMSIANINNMVRLGINNYKFYTLLHYLPTVIEKKIFSGSRLILRNHLVTYAFNVSGYFADFYLAYGMIGTVVITVIYGIVSGITFNKVINNKNEKNILYYAISIQIILLSFFYNHLLYLPSGFQYIIIYFIFNSPNNYNKGDNNENDN